MRWILAVLLAAALVQGAGKDRPISTASAAGTMKPDAAIEAAIRTRLAKSKISRNDFEVQVRNGVATLTGKTDIVQHKAVASRLAKLGGAVKVVNQIVISEQARAQSAARLAKAKEGRTERRASEKSDSPPAGPAAPAKVTGPAPSAETRLPGQQPPPPRPRRATLIK